MSEEIKMSERVSRNFDEENRREPGSDFAPCMADMTASECTRELNSLKRHLRSIPPSDTGERAEALACIMHIRARQLYLATRDATIEHQRRLDEQRKCIQPCREHEAKTAK